MLFTVSNRTFSYCKKDVLWFSHRCLVLRQSQLKLQIDLVIQGDDLTMLSFLILGGATLSSIFKHCESKEAELSSMSLVTIRLLISADFCITESVICCEYFTCAEDKVSRLKESSIKIQLVTNINLY